VGGQSTLGGQASTTRLSINETAYFGGSATTTFGIDGAGIIGGTFRVDGGLSRFSQASSTRFSVHDMAYFGGTATTTIGGARGNITTTTTKPSSTGVLSSAPALFVSSVSLGSRGDEVKRLQEFLARDKAIYPEGIANGNFGPLTKKALTAFQLKYGVIKDGSSLGSGRFGPATQAKVNELLGNVPEEKVQVALPTSKTEAGDSAKVKTLQDQLKALQDSLNLLKGTQ